MGDLTDIQRTEVIRIVGDNEVNVTAVDSYNQLNVVDSANNGGLDNQITVTTTPIELKVGASVLLNRKYVLFQALSSGISFGFSSSTQNIPIYRLQFYMLPVGENTEIWFVRSSGSGTVAIGEVA